MRRTALAFVLLALAGVASIAPARAEDDPQLAICNYISERIRSLIRVGDIAHARDLKSQLQTCIDRLKARSTRDAQRIVDSYERAMAAERAKKRF